MSRTYDQYCPVAVALDVLGDRWSLLVVRELLAGPRRFSDLQRGLGSVSTNLLTERLRALEEAGVIVQEELPPPAARTVYVLTADGRATRPALAALARWGMGRLGPPEEAEVVRPSMAVQAGMAAYFDAALARGVHDHHRFVLDGEVFDLVVDDGRLVAPPPGSQPDVVVTGTAAAVVTARREGRPLAEMSDLEVEGPPDATARLHTVFALVPSAPGAA